MRTQTGHSKIHHIVPRCRPYYVENTGSLPNSEVKRRKARLVLGSGTAWEPLRVLTTFYLYNITTLQQHTHYTTHSSMKMPFLPQFYRNPAWNGRYIYSSLSQCLIATSYLPTYLLLMNYHTHAYNNITLPIKLTPQLHFTTTTTSWHSQTTTINSWLNLQIGVELRRVCYSLLLCKVRLPCYWLPFVVVDWW